MLDPVSAWVGDRRNHLRAERGTHIRCLAVFADAWLEDYLVEISALEACSRRCAIQIHSLLYLLYLSILMSVP